MPLAHSAKIKKKNKDPMNMKIPKNPKYQHIKTSLDTGASMSKYLAKIEDIRLNYRYRKDEIFKRMKLSTFVQLVIKVAQYNNSNSNDQENRHHPEVNNQPDSNPSPPASSLALSDGDYGFEPAINTARSTLEGVSRGIGEMDLNQSNEHKLLNTPDPVPECPYLLLDLRDPDLYSQCHIISAVNFPIAMLSRSVNGEIKELLQYKNKLGKIICVYDEDERIAVRGASTLVQRGYDNLFLLSGGLKLAAKFYTDGFITGSLPSSISTTQTGEIKPALQNEFKDEDIDKLELLLDDALQDHTIGGRLSKASTTSSRMSTTSFASVRSSSSDFNPIRPPFRP